MLPSTSWSCRVRTVIAWINPEKLTNGPGLRRDEQEFEGLKAKEKTRAEVLQRTGKWRHLWRVAGRYANISVLDVADHDELHNAAAGGST